MSGLQMEFNERDVNKLMEQLEPIAQEFHRLVCERSGNALPEPLTYGVFMAAAGDVFARTLCCDVHAEQAQVLCTAVSRALSEKRLTGNADPKGVVDGWMKDLQDSNKGADT